MHGLWHLPKQMSFLIGLVWVSVPPTSVSCWHSPSLRAGGVESPRLWKADNLGVISCFTGSIFILSYLLWFLRLRSAWAWILGSFPKANISWRHFWLIWIILRLGSAVDEGTSLFQAGDSRGWEPIVLSILASNTWKILHLCLMLAGIPGSCDYTHLKVLDFNSFIRLVRNLSG